MIFDVEAPDYDEARAFMTPRQALEAALRAEKKAWIEEKDRIAKLLEEGISKMPPQQ